MKTERYDSYIIKAYKNKGYDLFYSPNCVLPGDKFISYFFTERNGAAFKGDKLTFCETPFRMSGDFYIFEVVKLKVNKVIGKPCEDDFTFYIRNGKKNLIEHKLNNPEFYVQFETDWNKYSVLVEMAENRISNFWKECFRNGVKNDK